MLENCNCRFDAEAGVLVGGLCVAHQRIVDAKVWEERQRHQVGRVSLPADLPGYAMTLEDALRHAAKLPPERCHAFVLEALKRIPERAEQLEFVACTKQEGAR